MLKAPSEFAEAILTLSLGECIHRQFQNPFYIRSMASSLSRSSRAASFPISIILGGRASVRLVRHSTRRHPSGVRQFQGALNDSLCLKQAHSVIISNATRRSNIKRSCREAAYLDFSARAKSTYGGSSSATGAQSQKEQQHLVNPVSPSASHSFRVAKLYYDGTMEVVNIELSELLRMANIYARDLFTLNLTSRQERRSGFLAASRSTIPTIVTPRDNVLILSFGNVRAVAGLEYIFLFDAHNPNVQEFAQELAEVYRLSGQQHHDNHLQKKEPAELIFLEKALQDTVESYQRRLRIFEPIVDNFLDRVNNEVYSDTGVHQLVPLKDSLQSFEIQVKQSLECLTHLLNNDDEMLELLLTEQEEAHKSGETVAFSRHEHVELLLGVYARQLNHILMEIKFFQGRLQSKQEFVALALSGYRNRMIRMNVHIGIAALTLGFGTTVAGFFGMNLISGLEQSPTAFMNVVTFSTISGTMIVAGSLNYLSGRTMRARAKQRLDEIETLTCALGDMPALDYTVKQLTSKGVSLNKEHFRMTLRRARETKQVTDKEIDLLFSILDRVKDGQIRSDDFERLHEEQKQLRWSRRLDAFERQHDH